MSSTENTVSLNNPTWEFLHSSFKRTELQKHCRDIGITKVWVTKGKLIDMILEKHRTMNTNVSDNIAQDSEVNLQKAMKEIEEIREMKKSINHEMRSSSHPSF